MLDFPSFHFQCQPINLPGCHGEVLRLPSFRSPLRGWGNAKSSTKQNKNILTARRDWSI